MTARTRNKAVRKAVALILQRRVPSDFEGQGDLSELDVWEVDGVGPAEMRRLLEKMATRHHARATLFVSRTDVDVEYRTKSGRPIKWWRTYPFKRAAAYSLVFHFDMVVGKKPAATTKDKGKEKVEEEEDL